MAVTELHLPPVSQLSGSTNLHLAIGLPLRNKEELNNLLQQIYNPASPDYRRYLTPEQFTERFGPTEQDYQTLIAFAQANGLTVSGTHPNRVVLDVEGAVTDIEKAFHVKMRVYNHPTKARTFYAPDVEPSLDLAVTVLRISGLDNYTLPHPMVHQVAVDRVKNATPKSGSGPSGSYMGKDFRAAYAPGVTLTGSGQMVGLVEFDGYYANDITAYEATNGLSNVTLKNVLLDGFNGTPTTGPNSGNAEVALDIEMAISMAPGLSKVIVYEAGPNGTPNDVLSQMVSDNQAKQLSCSWGWGGGPDATADQLFQQMAAQGQSFFSASGDSDAFVGDTSSQFPSDDPYITLVGGTTLTTTGAGGSYVSETVWNSGFVRSAMSYLGSSGGISTVYSIPIWQQAISMAANQGSTTMRNVPDVAMVADNVSIMADNGQQETVVGTSCATPLWAGFVALANQQAVANGQSTVGLINSAIYAIGKGANYTTDLHDITTGNNEWSASSTEFTAVTGYDLCTGWGTPTGTNLIKALTGTVGADLSVAQIDSPNPVTMNDDLTYTITVTNNGPTTSTSVIVTDTLPATVIFVSVASSQGTSTYVGGTVSCGLGSLTSNAMAIVQIVVIPTEAGVITNTATVSADQSDPNQANNTAAVTTAVLAPAQLDVSPANFDFGTVTTGTTTLATFVVTNTGGAMLTGTAIVSGDPFAVVSSNSFSVPGSGSANVVVSFTPPSPIDFSGDVVFSSNGGSFTDSLTGTGTTNAPTADTTPPTLIVSSPADYQPVTNAAITVSGTASDASGIESVTVNSAAASVLGTDWSAALTLVSGTNTITVIATDNSANENMATQIVHAVLSLPVNNQAPVIVSPPTVTNAVLQVGDLAVVVAGETNTFAVNAVDPNGDPLSYQWSFGDGTTSDWLPTNIAVHAYTTSCGPYTAGVTVSDGQATASSNVTVAVACQMTLTEIRVKLNFAKVNADSGNLRAILDLGAGFGLTNKLVTLNVGGAQVQFTLDSKGKGHGIGAYGNCKLSYNKKTDLWRFNARMKNGSWQDAWTAQGLVNATIRSPGMSVQLRVVLLIDNEAFATDKSLNYTAKAGKSGTAR
jgi:uncharacterized repeat protein (TIGR01451 family)